MGLVRIKVDECTNLEQDSILESSARKLCLAYATSSMTRQYLTWDSPQDHGILHEIPCNIERGSNQSWGCIYRTLVAL